MPFAFALPPGAPTMRVPAVPCSAGTTSVRLAITASPPARAKRRQAVTLGAIEPALKWPSAAKASISAIETVERACCSGVL